MMAAIRDDLAALNVKPDVFFSERSLIAGGTDLVAARSTSCASEGWFTKAGCRRRKAPPSRTGRIASRRSFARPQFGDDVDRPLIKSDGSYTYFASDIAYHKDKLDRGFPNSDRRVGRRPWRLRQAHARGSQGAQRRQRRAGRQDRSAGEAAARRRAGEDVQAER